MRILSDEEIRQLTSEWKGADHTVSGEWENFIRYCAKAQSRLTSVEVARDILDTIDAYSFHSVQGARLAYLEEENGVMPEWLIMLKRKYDPAWNSGK